MKPLRAMRCYAVKELPSLHILFSEEDGVIVARCLDFSISSHGGTLNEAMESMNSALIDYIEYGIEHGAGDSLFDPDLEEYWDAYRELEFEENGKSVAETSFGLIPADIETVQQVLEVEEM